MKCDRSSRLRIIVLGYVVRGPLGGMVWSNLQYLMGLAALDHDVYFVEDSDDYASCYDPERQTMGTDPSYGLRFADAAFARIGFGQRWAYFDAHGSRWYGPAADAVVDLCRSADLLLNLCGVNPLRPWTEGIGARALVDEDPAFTQIRHLTDRRAMERALRHTAFFTFAENFGRPQCLVPDDGLPWQPTRQPLVENTVTPSPGRAQGMFTTVMQWESYPGREFEGVRFGMKAESFAPYLHLPDRVGRIFALALSGTSAPRADLTKCGWQIIDAAEPTRDPWTYLDFIAASKAEFGVAKHGYVRSVSGWFSERSVAYLATGRPVVVQDTGFSRWLDVPAGVMAFSTAEEAVAAIGEVNARYAEHCAAARAVAATYFDSRRILSDLVERAMSRSPTRAVATHGNGG